MKPREQHRPKILIIDDEEEVLEISKEFLSSLGYRVTTVDNGFDALAEVLAGQYDLITMDLKMPGLSGLQATELIRLEHRIPTPVIVISGYLTPEKEDKLKELGVALFIHKPVDLNHLEKCIDTVLRTSS
jgi:CheY-like chemotaxis protein